jgi:D-serine deaminase-like pyridoxal phosphate-dependent protein
MEHTALIGHRVETLDTPALTIDLDILERNIAGLQS